MLSVSIVIPALNEAAGIAAAVRAAWAEGAHEVIVVDGGSGDETARIARAEGAVVVEAARGRARQMNAGAARATGDVFLFLHADTRLPPGGLVAIRAALEDARAMSGVFRLRFDRPTALLRFSGFATRLPLGGIAFGDRALFARRAAFDALGGFADVPIFEDLDMVRRLRRAGGFRFLRATVTTSARRFAARGGFRQHWLNLRLWTAYQAGVAPERLAHRYRYGAERG